MIAVSAIGAIGVAIAFTFAAYESNPLLVPVALAAVGFVITTFLRPAFGVAGAAALTPAEVLNVRVMSGSLSPAEGAMVLVGIAWLARALLSDAPFVRPSLRDAPIVGLLGIVLIGALFADSVGVVLRVFLLWTFFYFLYLQVQTFTRKEIRLVLGSLLVGAGVLGAIGTFNYLTSSNAVVYGGGELTGSRAAGTLSDPNYYASLLELALLPALAMILGDFRRYLPLAGAAVLALAGLIFSLSRGGISGFAAGLLLLLLWGRARWVAVAIVTLFALLTLANANPILRSSQFAVVGERLGTLESPSLTETSRRPKIWETALESTFAHPFFGVGVNQFETVTTAQGITERGNPIENAHSIPLSFAAETGLLGLTAFVVFIGQLAVRAGRALRSPTRADYVLALGIAAALLGFVLQGLTVMQMRVHIITAVFLVLAGMLTALADRAQAGRGALDRLARDTPGVAPRLRG